MTKRPYITPDRIGIMRDTLEIMFYFDLHPCPHCGSTDWGRFNDDVIIGFSRQYHEPGEPSVERYDLVCPACQYRRHLEFVVNRDPKAQAPHVPIGERAIHLGGPMPSDIIGPDEFVDVLLVSLANTNADFHIDDWDHEGLSPRLHHLSKLLQCVTELRKFLPDGATEIPLEYFRTEAARAARAAHPERFTRSFIDEHDRTAQQLRDLAAAHEARRSRDHVAKPPAPPVKLAPLVAPLTRGSFALHKGWLANKPGGQQLEVADKDASDKEVGAQNLTLARFERVVLDRANFAFATLHAAKLTDVRAHGATFASVDLSGSWLTRGSFVGAAMSLATFGDAEVLECDFTTADLQRSTWHRTMVTKSSFANANLIDAALDHVTFTDCDFRGADLAVSRDGVLGTAFEATFVRCDLRGSNWHERPLYRTRFVDCLFGGVRGTPYRSETVIERPDLSATGDGSHIGTDRDAYAAWGIDPDVPQRRYRTTSWPLSPRQREAAVAILNAHGIKFEETVHVPRDYNGATRQYDERPPVHTIAIQDATDAPVAPEVTAAVAEITQAEQVAAVNPAHRALAQRIIDECIDRGASFEETINVLMQGGFGRDEAMLAMTQPLE